MAQGCRRFGSAGIRRSWRQVGPPCIADDAAAGPPAQWPHQPSALWQSRVSPAAGGRAARTLPLPVPARACGRTCGATVHGKVAPRASAIRRTSDVDKGLSLCKGHDGIWPVAVRCELRGWGRRSRQALAARRSGVAVRCELRGWGRRVRRASETALRLPALLGGTTPAS